MRAIGIGAGGHARVLLEALQALGDVEIVGLVDADTRLHGTTVLGVPVLGGDELLDKPHRAGVTHAFVGVGGTGDNGPRARVFERARRAGLALINVVHPSAVLSRSASIGEASVLCPGAVVGAGARLGDNVIVNTGAIVEHDCVIGDHVHVASGAVLAGGVIVGDGAHIGAGASVKQGIRIGRGALVAMGAAVIGDVADGEKVAGVPARPITARVKS